ALAAASAEADEPGDEETTAEKQAQAEMEEMRRAEAKAGLLADHPAARDAALAIGLGEMHPLAQDVGSALGPSVDGSPLADPAPRGSVFAKLPELAGI